MKQKGQRGEALYWLDTEELEDGIHFSECLKTMSKERQRKVESCLLMKDKKLSLGAGILMDRGLSAYGLREREAMVAYGEDGKPYLPRHPHIHFNLKKASGFL